MNAPDIKLSSKTLEHIATTVVLVDDVGLSHDRLHQLLVTLCQLAFTDGAASALRELVKEAAT